MTKTFIPLTIAAFLFGFALLVSAPTTHAACSPTGFINSQGKCISSFNTRNQYQYEYYYARIAALQAYLDQLIALLEQLEGSQGGFPSGNADVDVVTRSATNIDDDRATLRGRVDFNNEDEATVYFEYGRSRTNLDDDTTHVVLEEDEDDEDFSQTITNLRRGTTYYFRAVAEDEDGDRDRGSILSFRTDGSSSGGDDEPDVETGDADDIDNDRAELNGSVDMNDFNNGRVFFVYGEDEDQVADVEDDYDTYSEIDEDGDNLQKVLVDSDLDGDEDYAEDVTNLDEDTRIYFSICVEYEDEDDDDVIRCGDVEDFRTDENGSSSNDQDPEVDTGFATDITRYGARLDGSVDMNDFDNGRVFFVYGEDEDQVTDVEDDYDTYSEIDEDGDNLQKIQVDSDLDSSGDYEVGLYSLDRDTDYYFSICVEYVDEDDDDVISCGSVEDFTTDD